MLFALLLFPAGFAGWAVGHYTSLGKPSATVVRTVTVGGTSGSTSTSSQTTSSATTTTSSNGGGGNVAAGKSVFDSNQCATCHTFKPAGATGTIGPDLDAAPAADAKADNNKDLAAFVKESIVDPDAYIAKGYSKGIMPTTFGSSLSSSQVDDLVAFILSGTKKS
jgi:mono/diheme cytochrome c family protein